MSTIPERISPEEVFKRVTSANALLVCAYESDERCARFAIEDSMPLSELKRRLPDIPKTQEIIFFCA